MHWNSDVATPQATATKAKAYFKAFAPGLALVRLMPSVLGVVLRTILVTFARGLPDAKWFALFLAVCFVRAILCRDLQTRQGGSSATVAVAPGNLTCTSGTLRNADNHQRSTSSDRVSCMLCCAGLGLGQFDLISCDLISCDLNSCALP